MTPQPADTRTAPTPLARKLIRRIAAHGPIPVRDYMAACLNDPEAGYYRTARPFGREGDFITAPEISQVFGELLGLWAASVWRQMGAPGSVALIELGPGRGTLSADALRAAKALPEFRAAIRLHLVETSPVLREMQAQTLKDVPEAGWHDALEAVPDGPAIILANEFLDALPVHQLVRCGGEWRERCVGYDAQHGLHFVEGAPADFAAFGRDLLPGDSAENAIAELRPETGRLLGEIARRGCAAPQAGLFIDYGHTEAPIGDTLQAVSGHRYAGVFDAPGEHDLTAHVDFRALARQAKAAGFETFGPMAQGRFLLQLGMEARCRSLLRVATPNQQEAIMSGVRRLADPVQMGELFKAMAITIGFSEAPPPFGDQQ
ncbi:MAG: class I SAM-dependent methyltransferase [Dichotomicrobium sp.]